jgi:3-oxoacyl-[acyl-carrier-protein] synthase II
MTGPSRQSEGLILAMTKAIRSAGIEASAVACVSAHGTGTVYNDAMEMRAFRSVFSAPVPVYSLKGGVGHTMGAAGLLELLMALRALQEKNVPPNVNLREADHDAQGWVSDRARPLGPGRFVLMTNAGFSGINSALVVEGRS